MKRQLTRLQIGALNFYVGKMPGFKDLEYYQRVSLKSFSVLTQKWERVHETKRDMISVLPHTYPIFCSGNLKSHGGKCH